MGYYALWAAMAVALAGVSAAADEGTTYTNPIGGDLRMGDPFVLRHDGRYYLYGTTAGDGFKCWASADLIRWEALGYAYRRGEQTWGVASFWAPEVTRYRDKFYMVYSCQGREREAGFRLCLAASDRPEGPFKDVHAPWLDTGWSCIDADLFIDDDGTPYLFFDKVGVVREPEWYMYGTIYVVRLSEDLSRAVTEPALCAAADQAWEEMDPKQRSRCNEGAFVFKHKGLYYMTYSSGHYLSPKYGIGWATARSPLGPWTKSKDNPLLAGDAALGVSGPGHSCMTWSPDGEEMFIVYHAHADAAKPGAGRTVNIDRMAVDEEGRLRVRGPTRSPQTRPSGAGGPSPVR